MPIGEENHAILERIANALERIAPPETAPADLGSSIAYIWDGNAITSLEHFDPIALNLLTGIDSQKAHLLENTKRHAQQVAAHDVLLWGSRGMGKSALVKAVVRALQEDGSNISIVEAGVDHLDSLPRLFALLSRYDRQYILFVDDIGFEQADGGPRALRSMLDGGAAARPKNVRLYVTSNRRHIVPRQMSEQDGPVNPRDVLDDKLALSDRFGLRLGFHAASREDYLAMIARYAMAFDLQYDEDDALQWSKQRGTRSGRVAWQFIVELAGRAGKTLS